jgi:hypothetical protein
MNVAVASYSVCCNDELYWPASSITQSIRRCMHSSSVRQHKQQHGTWTHVYRTSWVHKIIENRSVWISINSSHNFSTDKILALKYCNPLSFRQRLASFRHNEVVRSVDLMACYRPKCPRSLTRISGKHFFSKNLVKIFWAKEPFLNLFIVLGCH